MNEKELIKYLKSLGLEVHTSTKARGHQGFYLKNRIDISKNISPEKIIPTLIHEFTHYIHSEIEPGIDKNGGSIEVIFDDDNAKYYLKELEKVTNFADVNSKCEKLQTHKELIKEKIHEYENIIKNKYPNFMRSKKFKEFDNYIRKSDAKYLLKYDRVKLICRGFTKKIKIYSVDKIEQDFCDMPKEFAAYIRLRSCQKRQARISARINRLGKYYAKPTELFARFVESLYLDHEKVQELAPNCCKRFYELLHAGYYKELYGIYDLISNKELNIR